MTAPHPTDARHDDHHELLVEAFAALADHHLWAPDGQLSDLVERLTEAGFAGLQHSAGQWTFAMAGLHGNGVSLRAAVIDWHDRWSDWHQQQRRDSA